MRRKPVTLWMNIATRIAGPMARAIELVGTEINPFTPTVLNFTRRGATRSAIFTKMATPIGPDGRHFTRQLSDGALWGSALHRNAPGPGVTAQAVGVDLRCG